MTLSLLSSFLSLLYKARVVAKGYSQVKGIDSHEVFSLVVKHSSISALLALVEMEDIDVMITFLHGELDEEMYMNQPEGYEVIDKEDYVCRLERSLYSSKQSLRHLNRKFNSYMLAHNFEFNSYDSCVYMRSRVRGP